MLSRQEEVFLQYWEKNRDKEKKSLRRLYVGLPLGLLISGGIVLSLDLGWYSRANMVAGSQLNPYILLIAIVGIAVFTAVFYKKYRWDMNEQYYRELLYKKEREQNTRPPNAAD